VIIDSANTELQLKIHYGFEYDTTIEFNGKSHSFEHITCTNDKASYIDIPIKNYLFNSGKSARV